MKIHLVRAEFYTRTDEWTKRQTGRRQ